MRMLAERSPRPHAGWRLFQLVFLVSQLPALAWREHPESDFTPGPVGRPGVGRPDRGGQRPVVPDRPAERRRPTSGSRCAACSTTAPAARPAEPAPGAGSRCACCPCSRPSGSSTSWRSPTRSGHRRRPARLLRAAGGSPGAPFRVGFYAGGANTPNSLGHRPARPAAPRRAARRRYRLVDRCPYCHSRNVTVRPPDPVKLRLVIACDGCGR